MKKPVAKKSQNFKKLSLKDLKTISGGGGNKTGTCMFGKQGGGGPITREN